MSKPQLAQFQRLKPDGSPAKPALPVQFNPGEYTLNKGVQIAEVAIPGLDSPILQFVRGQNETLTLDLFFDTTDKGMGENATAVTEETDKFYQLIKMDDETHAPPICYFSWGGKGFPGAHLGDKFAPQRRQNGFKCIVESVRQRFTLFSPEGIPLRATLTVMLREYKTLAEQIKGPNLKSGHHTRVHVAQQGETLSRIAGQAYGDPAEWRRIAEFNNITDPLALQPGTILEIPPIE
jgi:LysM repeat protein